MGSEIVPFRSALSALSATVASSDIATVTASGKPLASLKAGSYDFVVNDDSPHAGLVVQKASMKAAVLTGVAFEGKRSIRVNLTAGKWSFFARTGRETQFVFTS